MIAKPIHSGYFKRNILSKRLVSSALIGGGLLFVVLIGATFSKPHKIISIAAHGSAAAPVAETMKIVPADPLRSGSSWSPLTGDGSN